MEIQVTARPNILLETVELLFAYVNDTTPEALTASGEFCLPVEAVREMMEVACAGISRTDPVMVYYFGEHTLTDELGRSTCIARNLVYDSMRLSANSVSLDCTELRSFWQKRHLSGNRIDAIDEFSLSYLEATEDRYIPLSRDISRLPVTPEYAFILLEQFSNYAESISRLETLIAPIAERLERLLTPWAQSAEPLVRMWDEWLKQPEAVTQFLQTRVRIKTMKNVEAIHLQFRYFLPRQGPGKSLKEGDRQSIYIHLGVDLPVEKRDSAGFEPWEFEALRLLGGETRMRMLRLMLDKPMSARELTKVLNLHLGTVCRDINSLFNAKLLYIECVDGRKRYRTDMNTVETLSKHMVDLKNYHVI